MKFQAILCTNIALNGMKHPWNMALFCALLGFIPVLAGRCAGSSGRGGISGVGSEADRDLAGADRDDDGMADLADACPLDPEDMDGFEDQDGCPDPDNDGDGVADEADGCPLEPEDSDSFADTDGCPDPDNDGDGIEDPDDECPNEAETLNEIDDEDGCPEPPGLVKIHSPPVGPYERLYYDPGDPTFKKEWESLLDMLAHVIKTNPVLRVEIAAHSDKKGSKKKKIAMTKKRAEAVVAYLESKGVARGILSAAGYGPVCCCMSPEASKNRRIEFILLETESGCSYGWPICDEAAEQGLVPEEDLKYLPDSDYCK